MIELLAIVVTLFIFIGLIIWIIWALSGNRKAKGASAQATATARKMTPPPGMASIYVTRLGFLGSQQGMDISVSDVGTAQIKANMFLLASVKPGRYVISAKMAKSKLTPQNLEIEAKAGDAVVALITMKMGAVKNTIEIKPVPDRGVAMALIRKAKMVEFDAGPVPERSS